MSWRASLAQAHEVTSAIQSADPVLGLLGGLQLLIVGAPFIGLGAPALRWAHRR